MNETYSKEYLSAIQEITHPDHTLSATWSAILTMENSADIYHLIQSKRRIDGTISKADIELIQSKCRIDIDEWALGKVDASCLQEYFNDDIEEVHIFDSVMYSLKNLSYDGQMVRLPMQLERKDYETVNTILNALGGKWNKSAKGHVFKEHDPEEVIADFILTGKLEKPKKFGFFPTPPAIGRELLADLPINEDSIILEPEAGTGNLAKLCAEIVDISQIHCFEIQKKNCDVLRNLGFNVTEGDFLQQIPVPFADFVVMNPPFEQQRDLDHVLHALKFLKPGGELRAIMSASLLFRTNRKILEFKALIESMNGSFIENPANAFKESGTLVRTIRLSVKVPLIENAHAVEVLKRFTTQEPVLSEVASPGNLIDRPVPARHEVKQVEFAF
ncbi:methyltransferase [Undibacterium oligocarboniphilum]|uniref:Methyltransferase n=1 Tax=Undibacterium oligocarboniphilum TaxID=666702 RepID=A0A850QIJ3_9BURK|nr:methyltransferase [Undibacterium oligocarboniphilum]MBC3871755.1 methyltransferase [Undibacterium oligocarboniphilum]NVO79391.1 methyltransferase [Undibacterium oligocarboniphilum]